MVKSFGKANDRGVTAKELSIIRNLSLPTIYDYLSQLEDANRIFWLRGRELGLKPSNAKFYSLVTREESLEEMKILLNLDTHITAIAQLIIRHRDTGISENEIKKCYLQQTQSKTSEKNQKREKEIKNALKVLLRKVLITKKQLGHKILYFPNNNIEKIEFRWLIFSSTEKDIICYKFSLHSCGIYFTLNSEIS